MKAGGEILVQKIKLLTQKYNILRVKGFASISGKPMRLLVQAVGSRVRSQYDKMWKSEDKRRGQLVVIAEHDRINVSAIKEILEG